MHISTSELIRVAVTIIIVRVSGRTAGRVPDSPTFVRTTYPLRIIQIKLKKQYELAQMSKLRMGVNITWP